MPLMNLSCIEHGLREALVARAQFIEHQREHDRDRETDRHGIERQRKCVAQQLCKIVTPEKADEVFEPHPVACAIAERAFEVFERDLQAIERGVVKDNHIDDGRQQH